MNLSNLLPLGLLVLCAAPTQLLGQSLTQSASGPSSILFMGSQATVDVSAAEASIGINNLNRSLEKNRRIIGGIAARGKSEEGLKALLGSGEFTPSAKVIAFGGLSLSNARLPDIEARRENAAALHNAAIARAYSDIEKVIENTTTNPSLGLLRSELQKEFSTIDQPEKIKNFLEPNAADLPPVAAARTSINTEVNRILSNLTAEQAAIETQQREAGEQYNKSSFWRVLFYGYASADAMQFKRYFPGRDTVSLSKNFDDVNFRGGQLGIGVNGQWRIFILGVRIARADFNNFDALTKREYTLRNTSTSGKQTLIQEKKLTAYNGDYSRVPGGTLDIDLIINVKLDEKAKNHALINPYLRVRRPNKNYQEAKILPQTTNVGCGFYFYQRKGKFLGGLYGELPDINNNIERNKPVADQNLREPWQRLSFGLVATFSINSLLDTF